MTRYSDFLLDAYTCFPSLFSIPLKLKRREVWLKKKKVKSWNKIKYHHWNVKFFIASILTVKIFKKI